MAIQNRRGANKDFDKNKMLPGEFAFTTDGSDKVFACTRAGKVVDLTSKERFIYLSDYCKSGTSDQTESIQNALNDSEDKILFIDSGTYCFSSTLHVKKGTRIIGIGADSVFKMISGGTLEAFTWRSEINIETNEVYVTPKQWIVTDGDNCIFENFVIDGTGFPLTDKNMCFVIKGKNHILNNITVHDITYGVRQGYGIFVFDADTISVNNCSCYRCGYEGIGIEKSSNVVVNGGYYHDCKTTQLQIHRRSSNISVVGVTLDRGSDVTSNAVLTMHGMNSVTFTDNTTASATIEGVTICGCNLGKMLAAIQGGENEIKIIGNHIASGIENSQVHDTCKNWVIDGNHIEGYVCVRGKNVVVTNNIIDNKGFKDYLVKIGGNTTDNFKGAMIFGNTDGKSTGKPVIVNGVSYDGLEYPSLESKLRSLGVIS